MVTTLRRFGAPAGGGAFESDCLWLATATGGRIARIELFEPRGPRRGGGTARGAASQVPDMNDADRKLAAIMFNDMVGHSALSRQNAGAGAAGHEHQRLPAADLRRCTPGRVGQGPPATRAPGRVQRARSRRSRCAIAIQTDDGS